MRSLLRVLPLAALFTAASLHAAPPPPSAEERAAFVAEVSREHGIDAAAIEAMLGAAKYQQSIIDAITRPAEAKPWKAYRPIFMTPQRIADGRAFLAQHRAALEKVEADTGVPKEIVVAILGVETSYGRITGSYRVLDALYTLAFHYPKRAPFFRSELMHVFPLARDEALDLSAIKGSYAGAMGWGQFMPSSYRAYARDGDGDGRRDLFGSLPDVFASVANYFVAHGWQRGEPVIVPAVRAGDATPFKPESLEPAFTLPELGERGYRPRVAVGHAAKATLVTLDGAQGEEDWIAFKNFYVISRYNRSPLYSLAVYQLSQAIAEPAPAAAAP
ncbi:MAG: lytic murein transglycosylase B [Chiayiivirga sp.]|jgi:membrane-bound lytic murein transglycosylase B|uniref:lytic murein transglycosylase B n=1 Tax=Chiayiivirga sp. TaxID=2041042 RepID=UPI0025C454EA|nr:lytic murein transglycosylase B [Chiayiivirga sp.]MCI1711029.1 lytic murein transglycosylase B [Chiayiivirga sp.]MCI1728153.1 lytic murein transglycosylase B [Chiayiivirga sp.]